MKRPHIVKRSLVIGGHKTSVSLEDEFWDVLKQAASRIGHSPASLVGLIDAEREGGVNLSSAIRLWVLEHVRSTQTRVEG